jgi:FMN reductase
MSDVVLISGSPSVSSRTATVLNFCADKLREAGRKATVIQVRDLTNPQSPQTKDALALIGAARAVVIGTPVYKASLTGLLKSFLDLLPPDALKGKVALPLATGAAPAHALCLEHELAPLLFALGADAVVRGRYFIDPDIPDGKLSPTAAASLAAAAARLITHGGPAK